jgi:hypothetical protein
LVVLEQVAMDLTYDDSSNNNEGGNNDGSDETISQVRNGEEMSNRENNEDASEDVV